MPVGFQAAQIVHAAGESIKEILPTNTHAVVLAVDNEVRLWDLASKLQLAGIPHIEIREVDPPYTGEVTAIGIVPLKDRTIVRKIFSNLPLLGNNKRDRVKSGGVCGSVDKALGAIPDSRTTRLNSSEVERPE